MTGRRPRALFTRKARVAISNLTATGAAASNRGGFLFIDGAGTRVDVEGSVLASDAFFPFADGLIVCADAGATAVIQPGGSKRDAEVIAVAEERGMAMWMTGQRHFRH